METNLNQCCVLMHSICDTCRLYIICPLSRKGSASKCDAYLPLSLQDTITPSSIREYFSITEARVANTAINTYIESQKPKSWIEECDGIICPHCGYEFSDEIRLMGHGKELPLNFCPVCGKEVEDTKR